MTDSANTSAVRPQRTGSVQAVLLYAGLALAFSPTLQDLLGHWVKSPWSRYSITFVLLLPWCVSRHPGLQRYRAPGLGLIGVGLLGQVLAARAAMLSMSRPTLAAATAGLLLLRGVTTPRVALLAAFAIPFPYFAMPFELANTMFAGGAALLSPFDLDLELVFQWHYAGSGGERLRIDREYGGLIALCHMLGLGYYYALRRGHSLAGTAGVLALCAAVAPLLQIIATTIALAVFVAGSATGAAAVLVYLPWLLPLPVAIALAERGGSLSEPPVP